ncbi:hypothetical protein SCP_0606360 [Sparassis crispa]|uniref:Uncharacterized protein n=1 Tax=Sparassis crispa TaxID=139825 RepID=A0A401GQZ3_9APHY|nr:hypothetical protein SCP_0606360 [Sparassis crispa]GBE84657.1 hypothetical protein SCP_0606360 [Sparassis crispa]
MSRPLSSFPSPPTRRESVNNPRYSIIRTNDGPTADSGGNRNSSVAPSNGPVMPSSTSSPFPVPSEHVLRTHRPPTLNLTSSSQFEPRRSVAPSFNSEYNTSTPPDSPNASTFVPEADLRREKMKRVTRRLGEGVPSHLVFPADASGDVDDEERPLLVHKASHSKHHRHSRRDTMSDHAVPSKSRGKEPIRAFNGPIPFDEMCGPWQKC